MNIEKFESKNYNELMKIWESSVLETHYFLKSEDFDFFKNAIPTEYLPYLDIYVLLDHGIKGFMAVDDKQIEMLFISAEFRGKGYGGTLLKYAIEVLNVIKVDVNEQNDQAVGFYKKFGFKQESRSEIDSSGREYPILHLTLAEI